MGGGYRSTLLFISYKETRARKEHAPFLGGRREVIRNGREGRTVTFTRYDVATLTRCPPRRSAKLLSQSAPVSRSQPSAAPALLGRGLVPQPNPSVGRRCHCPTAKRGFEIPHTHTHEQSHTHTQWSALATSLATICLALPCSGSGTASGGHAWTLLS